ncbi:hypothetical protein [Bosea sp. PAMC 26642]|uniref:hypothetical protein n=1 Tax=Bosea sp. (strain PAMC 26642) TaxID=1792307 RepID=UPI0007704338|nr:hypothetical protein [Bosea sp. PAMC 26642]AMJ63061.1 hypothetical protein AXW83_24635 [Bosea sp. PAMC 26642]
MTHQIAEIVDPLVPIREALPMAGLRPSKGYGEVRAGRLSVVRNGPRTYIRASEIKRYIDALVGASPKAEAA